MAAFAANGRGLAATAGFRRGADPSRHPLRFDPKRTVQLPTGRFALLLSGRERSTRGCFRFPWRGRSALRSLRTVRTAGPAVLKACACIQSGSPRPSERAVPFLGGGPLPIASLAGSHRAGDSPRLSSLASFLFRACGWSFLSETPAGPLPGDFRTIIDLRSGPSQQPNVSVRVASR